MIDILILAILGIGVGAFCLDVFGERGLESLRVDLLEHLALLAARGLLPSSCRHSVSARSDRMARERVERRDRKRAVS